MNEGQTIGVIIPYYQKEPGLLSRALVSVTNQELPADVAVRIIVVDDSSPFPPDTEIGQLCFTPPCDLKVVRQATAGAGAARNAGLDLLAASPPDFVAFLDSDDYWFPTHLRTALEHLQHADFYFANCMGDGGDHFTGSPFIRRHHDRLSVGNYAPVSGRLSGRQFHQELLEQSFLSTSQVVYRYTACPSLRFDTGQRRAGEDYLFWLNLSRVIEYVAYSTEPMGYRGRGISIHRGTLAWDSVNAADRIIDELKVLKKVGALSERSRAALEPQQRRLRDELMLRLLRLLRRHPLRFARTTVRLIRELPEYALRAPLILARTPLIIKKLRSERPG